MMLDGLPQDNGQPVITDQRPVTGSQNCQELPQTNATDVWVPLAAAAIPPVLTWLLNRRN